MGRYSQATLEADLEIGIYNVNNDDLTLHDNLSSLLIRTSLLLILPRIGRDWFACGNLHSTQAIHSEVPLL